MRVKELIETINFKSNCDFVVYDALNSKLSGERVERTMHISKDTTSREFYSMYEFAGDAIVKNVLFSDGVVTINI